MTTISDARIAAMKARRGKPHRRHAELVSASTFGRVQRFPTGAWTPKRVRGDGLKGGEASSCVPAVLAGRQRFQPQSDSQIMPMRVVALDQIDLPRPVPVLQLFLACDGGRHVGQPFVANKAIDAIAAREPTAVAVSMLPHARKQIGCNANVKRPARLACKDVDARLFHGCTPIASSVLAAMWTPKQVRGDGTSVVN